MKRVFCFLLTVLLFFAACPAFAQRPDVASPRAAVCGACQYGQMFTVTRDEPYVSYNAPCHNNIPGCRDTEVYMYRNTYYECNACGAHTLIASVSMDILSWTCPSVS